MDYRVVGLDRDGQPFDRRVSADTAQAAADAVRAEGGQVSEVTAAPAPVASEVLPAPASVTPGIPAPGLPAPGIPAPGLPAPATPLPLATTPVVPAPAVPAPIVPARGRLTHTELVFFSTHVAGAARLGLPLPGALRSLAAEASRPAFRSRIEEIARRVESGQALAVALESDRASFPPFYVRALEAGERAGSLSPVLVLLADHLRLVLELRRKMIEVLAYPVFLVLTLAVIISFYQGIAAELLGSYSSMGVQLPVLSSYVLNIAEHARPTLLVVFGVPLCLFVAARVLFLRDSVRRAWERAALRVPVYGHLLRSAITARFCHMAHLMLAAGVPAPQGLRLVADALGNDAAAQSVADIARTMEEGGSATDGVRGSRFLPATLVWLVGAGESRGELAETLREAAGLYETAFRHQVALLENVLGPVFVVLTGILVVSTMAALVVLPMVNVLNALW